MQEQDGDLPIRSRLRGNTGECASRTIMRWAKIHAALHTALTEYSTAVHKLGSPNPLPHKLKSKIIRISESAACSLEKCLQIILKQVDEIGCFTEQ
uniref:Uncharacterized protein n=1 Tax=Physcomitrium patens TaxID=3218 RepID=A0A2K1L3R8_PHYPA|nr:hypothetical protein PHYPA_003460 [Physcomitrium patens]